jgi:uncharacterized protein (TIGR02118 family)
MEHISSKNGNWTKIVLVVRRQGALEPAEIHKRAKRPPNVDGLVEWTANVGDVSQDPVGGGEPTAQAVVMASFARDVTPSPEKLVPDLLPDLQVEAYEVEERLMWDRHGDWPLGERADGFNRVAFVPRVPALTREQFADHWTNVHGPLALRHHPGIARYVQNIVLRTLTPDAPDWDGIAELHFVRTEDFTERMHDSAEGKAIVRADVARFIDPSRGERFLLGRWSILRDLDPPR